MPIRAIIFDIGGVLFRMRDFGPWRRWEARLGLPDRQLGDIVFDNPISYQAFVGEVTAAEAWDAELLDFIRRLRPDYKTGIISDAWGDTRQAIAQHLTADIFDVIVISAEEGVAKPDPEIFRRALSRLGVAPNETIFVDDRRKNVAGAQQIGMHAIRFTDARDVMEGVEHILAERS
jgi:epoxide hydrolase-like predicted phosphatase